MPAPMPIQIRYGPTGLLAQASSRIGANAGLLDAQGALEERRRLETELWTQELNRRQQAQQFGAARVQQLELEAQRMQTAQRGATPTSNAAYDSSSPLARSIMNMKRGYLESAKSEGVTGDTQKMLESAVKDPNVDVNAFRILAGEHGAVARRGTELAAKDADKKASVKTKQEFLDSLSGQLPPEYITAFAALVGDESVSPTQLRMAVTDKLNQIQSERRTETGRQIGGIDKQIADAEDRLKYMRNTGSVSPNAIPAKYSGEFRQPSGSSMEEAQNLWHVASFGGYTPSYIEKPPDLTGTRGLIEYQRELNNIRNLQEQRNALANPAAASAAQGGQGQQFQVGRIISVKGRQYRVTSIAADSVPILDPV